MLADSLFTGLSLVFIVVLGIIAAFWFFSRRG